MGKPYPTAEEQRANMPKYAEVNHYTPNTSCVFCLGDLGDESGRGIVEFTDGWFWICPACRQIVGKTLDQTQAVDYSYDIPPFKMRSRKRWLKYLEGEHQIKFEVKHGK